MLLLAAAALAVHVGMPHLNVVVSGSLPYRVFFLGSPGCVQPGDYLVFRKEIPESLRRQRKTLSKTDLLTKKVGCMPGEMLTVTSDRRFFCGDVPLGQALKEDFQGHKLPLFDFSGIVPQDTYFMTGSDPRSFDSKYFGFIQTNEIIHKAYPIW